MDPSPPPLTLLEALPPHLAVAYQAVCDRIASFPHVVIAYSGGVDSALVAALAVDLLGDAALAITGVSPALAPHLRQEARDQARWLGLDRKSTRLNSSHSSVSRMPSSA